MKRASIIGLVTVLVLSGCGWFDKKEQEPKTENETKSTPTADLEVTPAVVAEEDYYRSVIKDGQYVHGDTRGVGSSLVTTQNDLNWLELGLQQIAQSYFEPDQYYFQEGAYIKREEIESWLLRYKDKGKNKQGLNPALGKGKNRKDKEKDSPMILSRVLEHNYVTKDKDGAYEMGGIVIGVALNQVYQYRFLNDKDVVITGQTDVPKAEREKKGMEIAEKVVERMRAKPLDPEAENEEKKGPTLKDVPIIIALFEESDGQSVSTGHFFKVGVADPGKGLDWSNIDQKNLYFPSAEGKKQKPEDANQFDSFQQEIQDFSENHIGVVGRVHFEKGKLKKLVVDLNIQYRGKAEVVALTQHVANLVKKYYKNVLVNVNVSALTGELESVISHEPKEEPFIYIVD